MGKPDAWNQVVVGADNHVEGSLDTMSRMASPSIARPINSTVDLSTATPDAKLLAVRDNRCAPG